QSSQGLFIAKAVNASHAAWTLSLIGDTLPCDAVTGASVCYGTKLMRAAYAGKALNVTRASDSASSDIGFLSNGRLDTASLDAFCANTTCKVGTWYDQSGNANDCTQATSAQQPTITALNEPGG